MTAWTEQINKQTVVLPNGITDAMNGKIPDSLLSAVFNGKGVRIGKLNKPAARSFQAMVRQALLDGVPADQITATDTYRTFASQENLWDVRYDHTDHGNGGRTCGGDHRYLKKGMAVAACPGTSNHGKATAIDKGNGPAWHAWLEIHAHEYGWEWELLSEKWHLHYWRGDDIPQIVLDSEKGTQSNTDPEELTVGDITNILKRFDKVDQRQVNLPQNGILDYGEEGGDLNGFGVTEAGQALQLIFQGAPRRRVLVDKDAVKVFAGPWTDPETGTVLNIQIELKNGKIRWCTYDPHRQNFPNVVVDESGHPNADYHLIENGDGWHYFDM